MITWVLTEVTMGFVVLCADSVGGRERRPFEPVARSVLCMVTAGWADREIARCRSAGTPTGCP